MALILINKYFGITFLNKIINYNPIVRLILAQDKYNLRIYERKTIYG